MNLAAALNYAGAQENAKAAKSVLVGRMTREQIAEAQELSKALQQKINARAL